MTINNKLLFAAVEQRLAEGQQVQLPLTGISMTPTLRNGDILTLEPVGSGERRVENGEWRTESEEQGAQLPHSDNVQLYRGDVVLFRYNDIHLLHRIIDIDGDKVTTQGDNCRTTERCHRRDVVARLVTVKRGNTTLTVGSTQWQRISRRSLARKKVKNFVLRWLDRRGRRQLRPWYFCALIFLMWAPLNGIGVPLNNYIIGLRLDHLLHASVYIPCTLFLFDLFPRRQWLAWLLACCIGMTTEGVQYLLPYRGYDINDLVANFLGVSLGWLVTMAAKRKLSNSKN